MNKIFNRLKWLLALMAAVAVAKLAISKLTNDPEDEEAENNQPAESEGDVEEEDENPTPPVFGEEDPRPINIDPGGG